MAYLDFSADYPFAVAGIAPAPAAQKLGSQERLVVLLSRTDPLWSLRPRQSRSRLLRVLFGVEAPHHLADARLEALRRYAVTYRLRDPGVADAEAGAIMAGFAANQLRQVRHLVDAARAAPPRRNRGSLIRQAMLALAALLAVYGAIALLSPHFDSSLIAFVFVTVALLSFAPFAGKEPARR